MNNYDITKKLQSLLSESKLTEQKISSLLNGSKGKNIINSLSEKDKQKLMSTFMSMSNEEIKAKLKNADLSSLSGMSVDEILKKLR